MHYERIGSHDKLEPGKFYWVMSAGFKACDVLECRIADGGHKKLGSHWATPDHHEYLFSKFYIFGPIQQPTFDTIYLCNDHGGYGFKSDCSACKTT